MCLKLEGDPIVRIADKDIVCYKIVLKPEGCRSYRTLYQGKCVDIGKTYRSRLQKLQDDYCKVWKIERGLHSFKTQGDVFDIYMKRRRVIISTLIIKCTIPKGSKYYTGFFGNSRSYASNAIRYEEIVYTWKLLKLSKLCV